MSLPVGDERARVEEFYGRKWADGAVLWADRYPRDQQAYAISVYRRRNEAIVRALSRQAGLVLDLGCGAGDVAALLAPRAKGVVAADLSHVNVQMTRENLAGADGQTWVAQAGAEHLPFADASFEAVVLADVLEHVPEAHATLAEVRRVLRPGGVLACVTPIRATLGFWRVVDWAVRSVIHPVRTSRPAFSNVSVYERFFSTRELRDLLSRAGFSDPRLERICFYPAPETAGAFGALMRRIATRRDERSLRRAIDRAVTLFDLAARLRLGNQKQLWVVRA